jgi:hypothetical protein
MSRARLGSARVSRAGERVLAIANFSHKEHACRTDHAKREACFGATPKPTRETRVLLDQRRFAQPLLKLVNNLLD